MSDLKEKNNIEGQLFSLQKKHEQIMKYADICTERIKILEADERTHSNFLEKSKNKMEKQDFPEFENKIQEYKKIISELEHQRSESLSEVEDLKTHLQAVSESVKSVKSQ